MKFQESEGCQAGRRGRLQTGDQPADWLSLRPFSYGDAGIHATCSAESASCSHFSSSWPPWTLTTRIGPSRRYSSRQVSPPPMVSTSSHGIVTTSMVFSRFPFGPKYKSRDRKSTRLNSSHVKNSYAVFCLK